MSQLEQLNLLYELQKIDQQIQSLGQKKIKIPQKIKSLNIRLKKYENSLESEKSELAEINKKQRSLEGKLKVQKEELKKYQEQIKIVKNNKQYKALSTEIDMAELRCAEFEEEILESMEEADVFRKKIKSYDKEFDKIKTNYENNKVRLKNTLDKIDKDIAELKQKRKPFYNEIDDDLLQKYKTWHKKGLFLLSVVKGNICSGCNLIIPQQTINEVNENEKLITCGSCGRILFIP